MSSKSQSAIEFVILTGVVIFFLILFLIGINESMSEKTRQERMNQVKEIAITIQNEINLASQSTNGYQRTFTIPQNIDGQNYQATITEGMIYIKTNNEKYATALPVQNTTGQPLIGENTIQKKQGTVYLNSE